MFKCTLLKTAKQSPPTSLEPVSKSILHILQFIFKLSKSVGTAGACIWRKIPFYVFGFSLLEKILWSLNLRKINRRKVIWCLAFSRCWPCYDKNVGRKGEGLMNLGHSEQYTSPSKTLCCIIVPRSVFRNFSRGRAYIFFFLRGRKNLKSIDFSNRGEGAEDPWPPLNTHLIGPPGEDTF